MPNVNMLERKKAALLKQEEEAYKALKIAEDAVFALEDRTVRRGDRPSAEGE